MTTLQPRLDVPVVRASDGRRAGCAAAACRWSPDCRCTSGGHLPATPCCRSAPAGRLARRVGAARRSTPTTRRPIERSFGDWLADHGQPPATVEALWDLVGVATLNAPRGRRLARPCRHGLPARSADRRRARPTSGGRNVPLQELHGDAATPRAGAPPASTSGCRAGCEAIESATTGWLVRTRRRPSRSRSTPSSWSPAAGAGRAGAAGRRAAIWRPAGRPSSDRRRSSTSTRFSTGP